MKRSSWIAGCVIILVVAALCVVRLGCSRMPPSGRTLVRYCQWSGAKYQPVVWKLKEVFERENKDIEIQPEFYPRDYWTKLLTMAAGNTAPDVVFLSAPFTPDIANNGFLLDLTPYIERDRLDMSQYYDVIVNSFRFKDRLYGLPMQFGCQALYYNKDLFDRAGVPYPTDDWTWDDMLRAAQRLTIDADKDGKPEQYGLEVNTSMETYVFNYIGQAGGDVLDPSGEKCLLDRPEAIEAMQFICDLRGKYGVARSSSVTQQSMSAIQAFSLGKTAMAFDGSWMMDEYNKEPQLNYDVAPLPHYRRRFTIANGLANGINADSHVKEAAWRWCKFYASPEAQRILGEYQRGIPVMKSIANSPAFLNDKLPAEHKKVFLDEMAYAHDFYPSLFRGQWDDVAHHGVESIMNLSVTVPEGMRETTKKIDRILKMARENQ